ARLVESNPATLTVYPDAVPQVGGVSYSGTGFVLQVTGRVGLAYEVEASTDLQSWTTLETLVAPFTFSEAPIGSHRFFRLKAVGI
ncbi:MAG TPA: hypothetical protein VM735_02755, partial [Candidatus Kapabacteria bacterium]|nr:hypothetical protein [Candidatus Kapabacteria bacterium]